VDLQQQRVDPDRADLCPPLELLLDVARHVRGDEPRHEEEPGQCVGDKNRDQRRERDEDPPVREHRADPWPPSGLPGCHALLPSHRLDRYRFGDSLGVEGAGALCVRESLVTILSRFSSRYITTTIVRSWSAPARITDPSGVSSLVPSVRVISVPVSSTLCT